MDYIEFFKMLTFTVILNVLLFIWYAIGTWERKIINRRKAWFAKRRRFDDRR